MLRTLTEPPPISDKISSALKKAQLLQNLPAEILSIFSRHAALVRYAKGEVVFLAGDIAENFYVVKSGWVKLFRETLDGSQAVFDVVGTDHIFGANAFFNDHRYASSAEAIEPTELFAIPLALFENQIDENPAFARALLAHFANVEQTLAREIEQMTLQSAAQRIGCFILNLCDQTATGPVTVKLPYDKALVAARLGMQPETFSRALQTLKQQTNMQVKGSVVTFSHVNDLVHHACGACCGKFPCQSPQNKTCTT